MKSVQEIIAEFHGPAVPEDVFWSLVPGRHQGGNFFIAGAWNYGDLVCEICGDGIDIEGLGEREIREFVAEHPNSPHGKFCEPKETR